MDKTHEHKTVVGVFRKRASADSCYNALLDHGFSMADVNVMMSDKTRAAEYAWNEHEHKGTKAGSLGTEGMGVGGATGLALGATIAAIAAIGTSLVIPGLNLIVAGPLLAALAGGGAGALTGGILGGLIGLGIPEQDAKVYNKALEEGGVVMIVTVRDSEHAKEAERIMTDNYGEQVCRNA